MENLDAAPLPRLAVIELRYPLSPVLTNSDSLLQLSESLRGDLPIVRGGPMPHLSISVGQGPISAPQSAYRFMSRDLFTSATVAPTAAVVETTSYQGWPAFTDLFKRVLDAISALGQLQGAERIGLRYINEIRLPGDPAGLEAWQPVVSPEAVAPHVLASRLTGHHMTQGLSQTTIRVAETTTITVRQGLMLGYAVGDSPLKVPTPLSRGPYFLVDIDSATAAPEPVPPFDRDDVLRSADLLHAPIKSIFEGIVQPAYRGGHPRLGGDE